MLLSGARSSIALGKFRLNSGATLDISRLIPYFLKNGKTKASYEYRAETLYGNKKRVSVFFFDAPYRIISLYPSPA